MPVTLNDINFKAKSKYVERNECYGEIRNVTGSASKIIDELFYIGKTSTTKLSDNHIKFSDGFSLNNKFNDAKITVADIASLMINGGTTDSHIYKTTSVKPLATIEELTELLNELYLDWDENIEDFPSYRLKGLETLRQG